MRFTLPDTPSTDYSFTPDCTDGIPDDVDSDVTAAVGVNAAQTSFINLPLGVSDLTWDAGVVALAVEGIQIESTTTTIAPVTTDTLPFTGLDTQEFLMLGLAIMVAGSALLFAASRREDDAVESLPPWTAD